MSISFPNRLIIIFMLTYLLPTLVINLVTFSYIKKEMQADASSWLSGLTQNTGETMDSYIQLLNGITKNPAYDYTLNNILENHLDNREGILGYSFEETAQINGWLSMMLATNRKNIVSVELFDRNGNQFKLGESITYIDMNWIEKTEAAKGAAYLLPPMIGDDGRPLFAVSRLLYNPQTFHEISIVRLFYRLDFALETGKELLSRDGNLFLVNEQGQVIFDVLQQCLNKQWSQCAGAQKFQSHFKSDITNWTLITAMPQEQLFLKINEILRSFLFINLLFFVIAIMIVVMVSYRISSPLKRLSRMMLTAPKYQFHIDIPETKRTDEIGIITTSFRNMIGHIHTLIDEILSIEQRRKKSEIASLQAQINPHFLYNSLSAIVMQAEIDGNYNIATMAAKLGKLLRYSIGREKEWVNVQKECEYIKLYIEVMKYRYPGLKLDLQIEDRVMEWRIIKLLLQPIVENSIIHGIVPSGQEGTIRIEIKSIQEMGGNMLFIQIHDNGIGMEPEQLKKLKAFTIEEQDKDSMGIRNVYERILLTYTKGGISFDIESQVGNGTTFNIKIPKMDDESVDRR
ncbi:cache domain-containing sensor histidine kinase [Paenibacillus nasutitermitis]|uniref:histidine kinase n=1 Tax=Paenibacillus nasutitermitis TaxID=1652958 RepID=A0A917DW66_9BACL|nr:histidine kinase [Paenibacillus nasutitermitis]GGD72356.1 sensor histidine kinase YesM [Paenibacillus nasutitermitis]